MKVKGKIIPFKDNVIVAHMEFGAETTKAGIIIPGANGKTQGIHPRWGQVWAIGPEQIDVKVGDWVLVEHGRWTRTVEYETESGEVIELRMVDNNAIMLSSDEKPSDVNRNVA